MKTIFLDIDGTIFEQSQRCSDVYKTPQLIKGAAKKCWEWHLKGYKIILTTGRPSTTREACRMALADHNIVYDQLVMDLGPFPRYLVNNADEDCEERKAVGIQVVTNTGISGISLDHV